MDRLAAPLVLMFSSLAASAAETQLRPDWQRYFDGQGVQGTFVLFQPARDPYPVLDPARAQRAQRLVRDAMVVEKTRDYTIHAKSGSTSMRPGAIHWWVGWVEKKGKPVAYFAMNLTAAEGTKYDDRIAIARAILAGTGVLPS